MKCYGGNFTFFFSLGEGVVCVPGCNLSYVFNTCLFELYMATSKIFAAVAQSY